MSSRIVQYIALFLFTISLLNNNNVTAKGSNNDTLNNTLKFVNTSDLSEHENNTSVIKNTEDKIVTQQTLKERKNIKSDNLIVNLSKKNETSISANLNLSNKISDLSTVLYESTTLTSTCNKTSTPAYLDSSDNLTELYRIFSTSTVKATVVNSYSSGSKYTIEDLLTKTFPKKISNDTGLNPCKADIFLDDIAVSLPEHYQYFKNKRKFYKIEHFLETTENIKKEDLVLYEGLKRIEKQKWAHLYGIPDPMPIRPFETGKKVLYEKDVTEENTSAEELDISNYQNKILNLYKPTLDLVTIIRPDKSKKKNSVKEKQTKITKHKAEKPSFFKDFKISQGKFDNNEQADAGNSINRKKNFRSPINEQNKSELQKNKPDKASQQKNTLNSENQTRNDKTKNKVIDNLMNIEKNMANLNSLDNSISNEPIVRPKRAAATTLKERLWENGVIPYEIDDSFSSYKKTLAKQAMQHWENYTCLKFVPRNRDEHPDYVFFTERPCGCCSFVGKRRMGAQALSIGEDCAKFGIIVHEIGHAIGYYHEHTRPDRDSYVHILKDNILLGQQFNFNKMSSVQVTSLGLKYDYGSIMHYARNTYSKNVYLDTIKPIGMADGQKEADMGQRRRLSEGDIEQTNIIYQCPKCGRTFQTKSGTFTSPNYNSNTAETAVSCEWRISATPGEKITLNVTSMDIFKSSDCSTDYIEIRDGYWHKSPLLEKFCGKADNMEVKSNRNRVLITYVAKNVKEHRGFKAEFKVVCGGVLEIDKEGYLESPNYPEHYTENKECIWKITVPVNFQVALKFLSFDVEHQVNCNYDNIEIRDGLKENSTLLNKFCGKLLPPDVLSSSNEMFVKFASDDDVELGGFSAKVVAEFDECERTNHGCAHNCVNTLGSFQCTCNLGFELHSDKKSCVDACGGIFESPNGTVTSPSFPEFYPPNKTCTWEIKAPLQHKIFLNFTHFDIEGNNYEHQNCEYDQVTVSSILPSGKEKSQGQFCGKKKPKVMVSESNHLKVEFYSDDNVQQTGFAAVYFTDPDECATSNGGCEHDCTNTLGSYFCSCRTGFSLHENGKNCIEGDCVHEIVTPPFGTINSPNYPKYYPANKDCAWHISTVPGHRIRLGFLYFRLEHQPECFYDSVQIFDGDSSKAALLDTFCGAISPYLITSSENQLYLTFRSDKTVQRKGFWATYSTICGGVLQAASEKRKVYSHIHYESGENYENMANCDWYIIGGSNYNVHITFTNFDVEEEEDCDYDYVEIFDGIDSRRTSLGKYCGSKLPPDITSTHEGIREGITISFRSDDRFTGKGFTFEYESIESMYSSEEYA